MVLASFWALFWLKIHCLWWKSGFEWLYDFVFTRVISDFRALACTPRDHSIARLFFLVFVLYTLCFCSVKKLININLESHQGLIGHNFSPLHLRDVSIAVLFFLVRGPYPILSENIYLCFCPDKKWSMVNKVIVAIVSIVTLHHSHHLLLIKLGPTNVNFWSTITIL